MSRGIKPLDLDEEEETESGQQSAVSGQPDAAIEAKPKKRKAKAPRGEPTEADLAALDGTNWDEIKAEADALRSRLNSMGA